MRDLGVKIEFEKFNFYLKFHRARYLFRYNLSKTSILVKFCSIYLKCLIYVSEYSIDYDSV